MPEQNNSAIEAVQTLKNEVSRSIIGQEQVVERLVIALLERNCFIHRPAKACLNFSPARFSAI